MGYLKTSMEGATLLVTDKFRKCDLQREGRRCSIWLHGKIPKAKKLTAAMGTEAGNISSWRTARDRYENCHQPPNKAYLICGTNLRSFVTFLAAFSNH